MPCHPPANQKHTPMPEFTIRESHSHRWDMTPSEAITIQNDLARRVLVEGKPSGIKTVGGIDVAFDKTKDLAFCAVVIFSYPDLKIVEERFASLPVDFPYIPGLLTFREGPVILKSLTECETMPDLLIFDGQGTAHPRGLGIASHIGLLLDMPSIGCAKSRLIGKYEEPAGPKGSRSYLYNKEGIIGTVLRTRDNVRPMFVSPGHRVGFDEAPDILLELTGPYRVPEPTRIADIRVGEYKRRMSGT